MDGKVVDRHGRIIVEKGLIRIYTDNMEEEKAMLILDFAKFISNCTIPSAAILRFPGLAQEDYES